MNRIIYQLLTTGETAHMVTDQILDHSRLPDRTNKNLSLPISWDSMWDEGLFYQWNV